MKCHHKNESCTLHDIKKTAAAATVFFTIRLHLSDQQRSDDDAEVGADDVAEGADEHARADELIPALGDRHAGCSGRATDVGIGRKDDFLERAADELSADEAEEHVDDDHQEAEDEKQRCLLDDERDGCRHTDDEEEQVDEVGAQLLRTMHSLRLFRKNGGEQHRNGRDPYILAAEEGVQHVEEPVTGWDRRREHAGDELRDRHDDDGEGEVDCDITKRDLLPAPVLRRQGFALLGICAIREDMVDVRVRIVLPEPCIARKRDEDHEVDRHVEIIGDGRRGNQGLVHMEGICEGREVDTATDVGTGHHRCHIGKIWNEFSQDEDAEHRAGHCTEGTDQEDAEHTSGFLPDFREVHLQEQQRNRHRHREAPDHIIEDRRARRDDLQVREQQCTDQGNDGAADLTGPCVGLLHPDGKRDHQHHDAHQHPGVICGNECVHRVIS